MQRNPDARVDVRSRHRHRYEGGDLHNLPENIVGCVIGEKNRRVISKIQLKKVDRFPIAEGDGRNKGAIILTYL